MRMRTFDARRIRLVGAQQVERAIEALRSAPVDPVKPLEFILREEVKPRKLTQQALMWLGPLADIADQVVVEGRRFHVKVWHEHMKALYLPEQYDAELCVGEDYLKWAEGAGGEPVLVGSTTDLTTKGMARYLDQLHAFGGNAGVMFHEPPGR